MLHLGVAAWWGAELERQARAPRLEPLLSVPPSTSRTLQWEPRPATRVSFAPLDAPHAPEIEPAPALTEPVVREAPPTDAVAPTRPPTRPVVEPWSALRDARAPGAPRATPAAASAPPAPPAPPATTPPDAVADVASGVPTTDARAPGATPPEIEAPGEVAEPAPAPTDAASSSAAQALADNVPPAYPALALRRGWEGRVLLEVQVDAAGAARSVRVLEGSGVPLLDATARKAVERWRFEPARHAGRAEPGTTTVALRFQLSERVVAADPSG